MTGNRDWKIFEQRWKRHRHDNVRIHNFTWRAKPYCPKGEHDFRTTLFPDSSGGYRQCSKCQYTYGVGEY